MGARTLLYRLMVISPVALIAWIIGTSRFQFENFEFVACTKQQHEAIDAYREAVAVTLPMTSRKYNGPPEEIRNAAALWIEGATSGRLRPLTPVSITDSMRDGIKSEIRECETALSGQLRRLAERGIERGEFNQALGDLGMALMLSQILRSSDPIAEAACCHEEGLTLNLIEKMLPNLDESQLIAIQRTLTSIRDSKPTLDSLVRQTNVLIRREVLERPSEVAQFGELVVQAKVRDMVPLTAAEYVKLPAKKTRRMAPPFAELYLGIRARNQSNAHYERVLGKISVLLKPEQRLVASLGLSNFSL